MKWRWFFLREFGLIDKMVVGVLHICRLQEVVLRMLQMRCQYIYVLGHAMCYQVKDVLQIELHVMLHCDVL